MNIFRVSLILIHHKHVTNQKRIMEKRVQTQFSQKLISFLSIVFCYCVFTQSTFAEGTAQLSPSSSDIAILTFDQGFALSGSAGTQDALCFTIKSNSETIYFAFGMPVDHNGAIQNDDFKIEILNEAGTIVHTLNINGQNYNGGNHSDLVAGPNLGNGGYDINNAQYVLSNLSPGDYCIEFSGLNDDPFGRPNGIQNWDISIADIDEVIQSGRVWSKNWRLRTPCSDFSNCDIMDLGDGAVLYAKSFEGVIYALTSDNFVQKIDFANSGFRGLSFNLAFNEMGPGNSGDIVEDRKSVEGLSLHPKFKIFINPPDKSCYTAPILGAILQDPTFISDDCAGTNLCIKTVVTAAGQIEIIIDLHGNDEVFTPNTEDVLLTYVLEGDDLSPCVPWDGKNGLGEEVDLTNEISIGIHYAQGVIHFMQYDAESNYPGWTATIVDPIEATFSATHYWDDSNLDFNSLNEPIGPLTALEGMTQPAHLWEKPQYTDSGDDSFGEARTINTWWKSHHKTTGFARIAPCPEEEVTMDDPPVEPDPDPAAEEPAVIPTMDEWGLINLGLLLLIIGITEVKNEKYKALEAKK